MGAVVEGEAGEAVFDGAVGRELPRRLGRIRPVFSRALRSRRIELSCGSLLSCCAYIETSDAMLAIMITERFR